VLCHRGTQRIMSTLSASPPQTLNFSYLHLRMALCSSGALMVIRLVSICWFSCCILLRWHSVCFMCKRQLSQFETLILGQLWQNSTWPTDSTIAVSPLMEGSLLLLLVTLSTFGTSLAQILTLSRPSLDTQGHHLPCLFLLPSPSSQHL
jgi:hypothetical protein